LIVDVLYTGWRGIFGIMNDELHKEQENGMDMPQVNLEDFDMTRSDVIDRLKNRTARGGFVIPDTTLVRVIRQALAHDQKNTADALFAILAERCIPMFRKMMRGLSHRPDLHDEAISETVAQLWKEILDLNETFLERNFATYLQRLCIDNFKRTLRSEGLQNRFNDQGQVIGRPEHVPATLVDHIDQARPSDEEDTSADIADTDDPIAQLDANEEARRIIAFLPDRLDRKIVYLRVFQELQWEQIAQLCNKSERTMRFRYERAKEVMAEGLKNPNVGPRRMPRAEQGKKG
jgi:RNA polymerase sigma factor (sigma-70 family)